MPISVLQLLLQRSNVYCVYWFSRTIAIFIRVSFEQILIRLPPIENLFASQSTEVTEVPYAEKTEKLRKSRETQKGQIYLLSFWMGRKAQNGQRNSERKPPSVQCQWFTWLVTLAYMFPLVITKFICISGLCIVKFVIKQRKCHLFNRIVQVTHDRH